ncbi:transglutaminase-like putative cysteine protease [Rhodococcus rhodochrous J45]|uniref:Transglutaminase-like putative cysteine protease n=2 Tax=Rhodococcus rhodochrous TaxID=1829 RepID=A0A562E0H8_RHORH|nr:transglutaminase-like putative cysteine protease [Rhodococcus rhodochrous J45]
MSWRMRVVHKTGYEYDGPVTASYNEARLTPRSDGRQTVVLNRVETTPATRSYRYTDYWGSAVTAFDLHAPHTSLEVVGHSVVETEPVRPPDEPAGWDVITDQDTRDRYDEVLAPSAYVPTDPELEATARELARGLEPVDAVIAAAQWVYDQMDYVPGTTGVHTSALQAFEERQGVCQDYAHLTLLLLRRMGIPARYVSGYLHPVADAEIGETVAGQSHAWIQAWTGSWWGYDPTNAKFVSEQHTSVAIGRDYTDVPPLKGIYMGGHATAHEVVVEVTRLA